MTDFNSNSNNASIDEREQRLRRREARRLEAQALSSISEVTENQHRIQAADVMMKVQDSESNESRPAVQPEEHHSVENQGNQRSASPEANPKNQGNQQSASPEADPNSGHLKHPKRNSNATAFSRKQMTKIKFPPPNDPIWGSINKELASALPRVFTDNKIKNMPIDKLSSKFDSWLHAFFVGKFGIVEPGEQPPMNDSRPKRVNRQLQWFRQRKKECRCARRALKQAGLLDSPEGQFCDKTWKRLVKGHNKVRRNLALKQEFKNRRRAEKQFRKDPNQFAKKLFNPPNTGKPTFDQNAASVYFSETYRDECRDHIYTAMDGQQRPPPPKHAFHLRSPTLKELFRSVKRKRNKASPGFNSLTYVPYKKCPAIIFTLHKIGTRIWNSREVPSDWGEAFIILLAKSEKLDDVSKFRPIALTCTVGKIFLSPIADRIQSFMIKNEYIDRSIQKGFLSGIAGCLEHNFALYEALREAKEHTRQIVVVWLDLANAYGSVRHNLIQFALDWYHIPKLLQELIFDYYEKLRATVQANDWSTGFFLFDIGLFQGCVLSTILFDCVFQLLLDLVASLDNKCGYKFKTVKVNDKPLVCHRKAYADDLALIANNAKNAQLACDRTNSWLNWTETMKAKPAKCVSTGMRQFDKRIKNHSFVPTHNLTYSPFDPKLSIAGKAIKYMYDPEHKDGLFEGTHFKFVGRRIHYLLKEGPVKEWSSDKFLADLQKIGDTKITGFQKAWLYEFYGLNRVLTWLFLVHDLDRSFAVNLEAMATRSLKKWIGIYTTAETGILYRSKEHAGLGLTPVTDHFERMQIVKCQILKNSVCADIRAVYQAKVDRESNPGRKWRYTRADTIAQAAADLHVMFPRQNGRQGLGHGNFEAKLGPAGRRKLTSMIALQMKEEKRVSKSHGMARQGAWTKWNEKSFPFDLSWKNLLYGIDEKVIKFVLHSSINWIKTPDLLKLWGKGKTDRCKLCNHKPCSIHHIISNCKFALNDKRYTWRHDSVLLTMDHFLRPHVKDHNASNKAKKIPHVLDSFVRSGEKKSVASAAPPCRSLLDGASDWKILTDFESNKLVFPPEILSTNLRPDIVIWSISRKRVVLLELTCPAEEGFANATTRKLIRYDELMELIRRAGWEPFHYPFEVGARGFVARSTFRCISAVGLKPTTKRQLIKALGTICARCSYTIYLSRDNRAWDRTRELLCV